MMYSRFATREEVAEITTKVNLNTGLKTAGIPLMYDANYMYIDDSSESNLIIGSSGSGKTQALILPMLKLSMMADESFVVNDPKGEIYENTAKHAIEQGYDVKVLDFGDPRYGNSWNIFSVPYKLYKENNKDKAIEILNDMAYYFVYNKTSKNNDPFWVNSAISYFVGISLYLFENAKENEINIESLLSISDYFNKKDITSIIEKINKNSTSYRCLSSILLAPPETRASIISVFNQALSKYVLKENLKSMLSFNDLDLFDITSKRVGIYIVGGKEELCNHIIPMLISQIIEIIYITPKTGSINLLLDDFDDLIPIKNFSTTLSFIRNMGVKLTAAIKSYTHLNNMYSKEEADILKLCFKNIVYLLSQDKYTLEEISNECGNTVNDGKVEPLISVEELKVISPFCGIVLMPRMMPFKTKYIPDYKMDYGYVTEKINIPSREEHNIEKYMIEG